ncbi:hypothetical protein DFH27DRAFT_372979 [Peziza echinospora]|nr:hypothetical protein DFH27DRAFT_372979 [Peziza echinospora]
MVLLFICMFIGSVCVWICMFKPTQYWRLCDFCCIEQLSTRRYLSVPQKYNPSFTSSKRYLSNLQLGVTEILWRQHSRSYH